jgi:geranylgeranyl diphosphate synthase, type I
MLNRMREARTEIKPFISAFLEQKKDQYRPVNKWSTDLFARLDLFMNRAKMLRGGMILVGHDLFQGEEREAALMSAAAIELVHSAFLIHDDIMDQDDLRRGEKTVYHQYEELGNEESFKHPRTFGQSMGICAGDEAFFLAYDLLISLPSNPDISRKILQRFTHEMKRVGLAQMQDVEFGHSDRDPSEDEILQVYRYKTACYTFSLPLCLAAILGGCSSRELPILEDIGECLGIVFQLKDDDLGVFGEEETIGKTTGSDIREDKKTLFRYYLKKTAVGSDGLLMAEIFGNKNISANEIQVIRQMSEKLGVRARIEELMLDYVTKAKELADALAEASPLKPLVLDLLDYSLTRAY